MTIQTFDQKRIKVRLLGIDAPELKQPFGAQSKQILSSYVFNNSVTLKNTSKDQYGRTLADVYVGQLWVNMQMVKSGYAWQYKHSTNAKLAEAQAKARGAKKDCGLIQIRYHLGTIGSASRLMDRQGQSPDIG